MNKEEKVEALYATLNSRGWLEVIKPALEVVIDRTTEMVMDGSRTKMDENATDGELKNRVAAFKWVLGWEKNYKRLVDELEALTNVQAETEPASEGGSPYA